MCVCGKALCSLLADCIEWLCKRCLPMVPCTVQMFISTQNSMDSAVPSHALLEGLCSMQKEGLIGPMALQCP